MQCTSCDGTAPRAHGGRIRLADVSEFPGICGLEPVLHTCRDEVTP